uniref:Uncharacterized protein n=1 Tax=Prolemur simus TaxID=1328070 RepID=A0A8C8YFE5_PROSS
MYSFCCTAIVFISSILVLIISRFFSFFIFIFWIQGLALSHRLEYSGITIAHCNLKLLGSGHPSASASCVAGTIGAHHDAQLIFLFFVETGSHSCSGWSQTPSLKRSILPPPQSPKVLGLQI